MYFYMNGIKTGERSIHLTFPIDNPREIAIVNFFQDTTTWKVKSDREITLGPENSKFKLIDLKKQNKIIPKNTYTERSLKSSLLINAANLDTLSMFPEIDKVNCIVGKQEINFYLNELDNTQIFENNQLSNLLLKYYITNCDGYLSYQPTNPVYKPLKNGIITSLSLKITDENNNLFEKDLGIDIQLHIH